MVSQTATQSSISKYSQALSLTVGKKTCTNLSQSVDQSHDSIYRQLRCSEQDIASARMNLIKQCVSIFGKNPITIVIDDTNRAKPHSELIEGVHYTWDSSLGRAIPGLPMITCVVTDGKYRLPIDCLPFVSKTLGGKHAPTKSELAKTLIEEISKHLKIKRMVADAHFSTIFLISDLYKKEIPFCMKFTASKKITFEGKTAQVRDFFIFSKNTKRICIQGIFHGMKLYFYGVKRRGKFIFFASNTFIERKDIEKIYKLRWIIEVFHRTIKQSLGLSDCQSRSFEKQLRHALYVIEAYVYLEIERINLKLPNIEEVIRRIRSKNTKKVKL